jgi:hypothetical protein
VNLARVYAPGRHVAIHRREFKKKIGTNREDTKRPQSRNGTFAPQTKHCFARVPRTWQKECLSEILRTIAVQALVCRAMALFERDKQLSEELSHAAR